MKTGSESSFSPLQSGFYPPPQAFPKQLSAASLRTRTGPAAAGSVRSSLRPAPRGSGLSGRPPFPSPCSPRLRLAYLSAPSQGQAPPPPLPPGQ